MSSGKVECPSIITPKNSPSSRASEWPGPVTLSRRNGFFPLFSFRRRRADELRVDGSMLVGEMEVLDRGLRCPRSSCPCQVSKPSRGLARVNRVNFGLPLGLPLASLGQTRLAKQLTRQTREWLPRLLSHKALTLNTANGARSKNEISTQN